MRVIIYPYKLGSQSAKDLQAKLVEAGIRTLRVHPDGRYRPRQNDVIINWGNSHEPNWSMDINRTFLNTPHAVGLAANKLNTFRRLTERNVPTIPWTTDPSVAREWMQVYVRHELNSHSGAGIEIVELEHDIERVALVDELRRNGYNDFADQVMAEVAENRMEVPDAELYTKSINNHGEYRVHVFNGEIIDYRKKSRHYDDEPTEEQKAIRTLGNGWVYRANHLERLERIEQLAIQAIDALDLDFGAVDIIKDAEGNVFVLEVNTAVGMDDHTLSNYTTKILETIHAT